MKVLVISDLHLGDGSKADDFNDNDNDLIEWIKNINPKKIYIAGDLYELWQFKPQKIRNAHYLLIRFLQGRKFIRIKGNHDYQLMGPLTKTLTTKSGKQVLISHGFQNDPMMTNPFTRLGIWALTWIERFIPNIDNENAYNKKRKKSRTAKKTLAYAKKMLETYDMVICGHTHKRNITTIANFAIGGKSYPKVYANCGSCANGKTQGILLDTNTDDITVV